MKILLLDIETAPKVSFTWGTYNQNISSDQLIEDMYVLCWSAKWLGKKKIMADALYLHPKEYKKDKKNDIHILRSLRLLMDEADIIIAHNGASFDIPTINSRMLINKLTPPSSYRIIDTLAVARKAFKFTSNRLDDLGKALGVGRKLDTGGFMLWRNIVLHHDKQSFQKMLAYNKQDVILLENVYKCLRAWDKTHPALGWTSDKPKCNACGRDSVVANGTYVTNTGRYRRFVCKMCGHTMRSRVKEKDGRTTLASI